jgi:hypothetical protein
MPSARELLEQADALMRKNRSRGDSDIPLLTDAVAIAPAATPVSVPALAAVAPRAVAPRAVAPPAVVPPVKMPSANMPSANVPSTNAPSADVPLLTDAVEDVLADFELLPEQPAPRGGTMEGDPSDWLVMDTIDPATHSITGRAPDTLAVVPPMTLKAAGSAATPPPLGSQSRQQTPAPVEQPPPSLPAATATVYAREESESAASAHASEESDPAATVHASEESDLAAADQELWRALAEQISMQVLQRLDLFTDTGLKEQLAQRLEPIVERASTELVGAITEHVGRLLRTYVSEAIEREIAQWKRDQH